MPLKTNAVEKFVELQLSKGRTPHQISQFLLSHGINIPQNVQGKKGRTPVLEYLTGKADPGSNLFSAMGNLIGSADVQDFAGKVAGAQEKVQKVLEKTPVTKQILGAAGAVGRTGGEVIGSGLGTLAQPIANVQYGRPLAENVLRNTEDVGRFGGQLGTEIGKRAPLNIAVASLGGSVLNTGLGAANTVRGVGQLQEGDVLGGASSLVTGASQLAGAAKTKKVLPFGAEKRIPKEWRSAAAEQMPTLSKLLGVSKFIEDPTVTQVTERAGTPYDTKPRELDQSGGPGAARNVNAQMKKAAVEHLKNPNKTSAEEIANDLYKERVSDLGKEVNKYGEAIGEYLTENGDKVKIAGGDKFKTGFLKAIEKWGLTVDEDGKMTNLPGRTVSLASGDVRLLQTGWDKISQIKSVDTLQNYKDVVRGLQNDVNFGQVSRMTEKSTPGEGFLKMISGKLNERLYTNLGDDTFLELNQNYNALNEIFDFHNSILKQYGKGGEGALRAVLNSPGQSVKINMFNRLDILTGAVSRGEPSTIDYALLAAKAMQAAGDPRGWSFFPALMKSALLKAGGIPVNLPPMLR